MKKKLLMLLLPAMSFVFCIGSVDAASIAVKCKDVTVGSNTTCTISVSGAGATSAISGKISISGANFSGASNGSGFQGTTDSSSFDLYREKNVSGGFTVATVTLSTKNAGAGTLSVSNVVLYDADYNQVNIPGAKGSFKINAKTTTTTRKSTTTTTRSTTAANTRPVITTSPVTTTTTTRPTTAAKPLRLTSVSVQGYEVTISGGVYYATVDSNVDEVIVGATTEADYVVIGTGKRTLVEGNNSVELIVRDALGNSETFQLIIIKPAGSGPLSTKLIGLKVANYPFAFNPDTYEYTITVPYNTNEVYVVAEAQEGVKIQGDGIVGLSGKSTDAYITVTTGDGEPSTYVIHINKSYTLLLLYIGLGTLGIGFIGALVYANINKKAAVAKAVSDKNRQIAASVREEKMNDPLASISVGGASLVGTGKSIVAPTAIDTSVEIEPEVAKVVDTKEAEASTVARGVISAQTASIVKPMPVSVAEPAKPQTVKVVKKVASPQTSVSAKPTVVKTVVKPVNVVKTSEE